MSTMDNYLKNQVNEGHVDKIALIDENGYAVSQIGFNTSKEQWKLKAMYDIANRLAQSFDKPLTRLTVSSSSTSENIRNNYVIKPTVDDNVLVTAKQSILTNDEGQVHD